METWLLWTILLPIVISYFLRLLFVIPRSSLWLWIFFLQIIFFFLYIFRLRKKRSSTYSSSRIWVIWTIFYPILIASLLTYLLRLLSWSSSLLLIFLEVVFWLFYIFKPRKKENSTEIEGYGEGQTSKDGINSKKWKDYSLVFVFMIIVCMYFWMRHKRIWMIKSIN